MVVGLLVLFREKLNHQGKLAKDMAACAYTIFLIHLLVIVFSALTTRDISTYPPLKYLVVAPLVLVLYFTLANLIRQLPFARDIL